MFCGIIQDIGTVGKSTREGREAHFALRTHLAEKLRIGDSLAINGVCLTVTRKTKQQVSVTAIDETLQKTNLGELEVGSRVNLEPAMRLGDPVGGHLVQGHVEGTGRIYSRKQVGDSLEIEVEVGPLVRYLVPKGSVAIDGISLTVTHVTGDRFGVALIPHTLAATTIADRAVGAQVNVETDLIGKYVERLLGAYRPAADEGLTVELLKEHGYA